MVGWVSLLNRCILQGTVVVAITSNIVAPLLFAIMQMIFLGM